MHLLCREEAEAQGGMVWLRGSWPKSGDQSSGVNRLGFLVGLIRQEFFQNVIQVVAVTPVSSLLRVEGHQGLWVLPSQESRVKTGVRKM